MSNQSNKLAKLQEHAKKVEETEYETELEIEDRAYEVRLRNSLQFLQDQVKEEEDSLQELRLKSSISSFIEPSKDPLHRIHELEVITAAYQFLTDAKPVLPSVDSPLPALLALRSTHDLLDETKTLISITREKISDARSQLHQENQDLHEARLISDALKRRTEKLQFSQLSDIQASPEELAKAILLEEQVRKRHYVKGLRNLVRAFNKFVEEHLAAMLAVEELGGPVVGEMLQVDKEALKAGFNSQGKLKKLSADAFGRKLERKRRIDEIWGPLDEEHDPEVGERSKIGAAGAAFRDLSEELLNAAAGDEDSDPYVDTKQETAAVRFLVRAKIAQFHPQDARKLRLVDFTGELHD